MQSIHNKRQVHREPAKRSHDAAAQLVSGSSFEEMASSRFLGEGVFLHSGFHAGMNERHHFTELKKGLSSVAGHQPFCYSKFF